MQRATKVHWLDVGLRDGLKTIFKKGREKDFDRG